jgi:N-succinyldiaminopimelate aminotransferase
MTVSRLQPYAITVFAEMSALAARLGAVNLGQGFPDEYGPPAMLKVAENAIAEGVNQYPPGLGIAPLREAIAAQRKRHFGTDYDPDTEVLVTVGATEAIASAVLGLIEPGSEVLLIEPFYDSYSPVIAMAGCERRAVPLIQNGRGFAIDVDGLRQAVTPKTKALIVNSPHNPTGMVASDADLRALAQLAVDADLLVITDQVYEHLVFDGHRHIPLANLLVGRDSQIRIVSGFSIRRTNAAIHRAATSPSITRWSAESVTVMTVPTASSPSTTTGRCVARPTARMPE